MRIQKAIFCVFLCAGMAAAQRLDLYPARTAQAYELQLSMYVSGDGPFSFRVEDPQTLPPGFTLDPKSAILAGNATVGDRDYAFTVCAYDVHGSRIAATDYLLHVSSGVPLYRPISRVEPAAVRTAPETSPAVAPPPAARGVVRQAALSAPVTAADPPSAPQPASPATPAASRQAPAAAPAPAPEPAPAPAPAAAGAGSDTQPVFLADWGRVRAYFTAGAVFAHERDEFSKSDVFLSFELDKNWHSLAWRKGAAGFNTFFETRLTAVPVSSTETSTTNTTANGTGPGTSTTTPTLDSVISSRKSAVVQVGGYIPWVVTTWRFGGDQNNPDRNGLFLAPLLKGGFITPTSSDTQLQQQSSTTTGTQTTTTTTTTQAINPARFYNFWVGGIRLGHYRWIGSTATACLSEDAALQRKLTEAQAAYAKAIKAVVAAEHGKDKAAVDGQRSAKEDAASEVKKAEQDLREHGELCDSSQTQAPELVSHLDIGVGRFSNMEVLAGPSNNVLRHRRARLQMEGLLKIPGVPLDVGFSANLGMLPPKNQVMGAKDDLRFLVGTHFDIGQLVDKVKLGTQTQADKVKAAQQAQ